MSMNQHKHKVEVDIENKFKSLGVSYSKLSKKSVDKYIDDWLNSFAPKNCDMRTIKKLCIPNQESYGYLWHVFSFEIINSKPCEIASQLYDNIKNQSGVVFLNFEKIAFKVDDLSKFDGITANKYNDIIITADDFSWTYVHTHESDFGPYFYKL